MKTKQNEVQHSPTPWKLKNSTDIVCFDGVSLERHPVDEVYANYNFIVRAVNSHDALLNLLDAAETYGMNPSDDNRLRLAIAGADAKKVIAQAEGK